MTKLKILEKNIGKIQRWIALVADGSYDRKLRIALGSFATKSLIFG